jgi:serine/threonine-protein kinase
MAEWSLDGFTELRALGEGGFGRVVLARHDASGQTVAIKYLFARFAADPGLRAQFRHEAALLRNVVSPHVTRFLDFVETDNGAAIVMEAVPGVPLRDVLAREPVLPPESALAILKGSLLGLAAAHAVGTVHRDYKPANVLVQPDRQSKLVDFGIAVLAGNSRPTSGTPAYMAPEQWAGAAATPATDVYAATCVFFQCVTGHRPYEADTAEQLRQLHLTAETPADKAPEAVRSLVQRGMAKDPAARPASAAAFVGELEAAARAGYGPDWEARGWQRLAAHAGTLLTLSPLALLGSTATGTLAPAAGAAGGGVLSTVAAKVAAIVVGVVVAAGATAVVVANGDDDTPGVAAPEARQVDLRIDLEHRAETFDTFSFEGRYPRVSGLGDPALEERVDDALAVPVDDWIDHVTDATSGGEPGTPPATAKVEASVRIAGPKVVSIDYLRLAADGGNYFGARGIGSITGVLVDLATGETLTFTDVFPGATTIEGAASIAAAIREANPEGLCGPGSDYDSVVPLELTPRSFTDEYSTGGDPVVDAVFTDRGVQFVVMASAFGYPQACDQSPLLVPYDAVTDLMSPEATALLVSS